MRLVKTWFAVYLRSNRGFISILTSVSDIRGYGLVYIGIVGKLNLIFYSGFYCLLEMVKVRNMRSMTEGTRLPGKIYVVGRLYMVRVMY